MQPFGLLSVDAFVSDNRRNVSKELLKHLRALLICDYLQSGYMKRELPDKPQGN